LGFRRRLTGQESRPNLHKETNFLQSRNAKPVAEYITGNNPEEKITAN